MRASQLWVCLIQGTAMGSVRLVLGEETEFRANLACFCLCACFRVCVCVCARAHLADCVFGCFYLLYMLYSNLSRVFCC